MRDGAEPVPAPLGPCRVEGELAGDLRDVEFGPRRVAEGDLQERAERVVPGHDGPLVAVDRLDARIRSPLGRETPRVLGRQRAEPRAGPRRDRGPGAVAVGDPVDGLAATHLQAEGGRHAAEAAGAESVIR
ncbi:hypothetical protein [Methylobacterium oryzae]|uniref:hypothetical protein n=1 Tax=Methylobacterium oryzae TaxID=334852 RepID=UPI002F35FF35